MLHYGASDQGLLLTKNNLTARLYDVMEIDIKVFMCIVPC